MSDYRAYYSWGRIACDLIKSTVKIIFGGFVFVDFLKKSKNTHLLILMPQLGDSIVALSYLEEFKRQRNIRHVTVVCTPYVKRLCSYYPETVDDVLCQKRWKIAAFCRFSNTVVGNHLYMLYIDRFTILVDNVRKQAVWDNPVLTMPMVTKIIVYKIAMSSKPKPPQIPYIDISETVRQYDLIEGKTIFFNPFANSVRCDITELLADATIIFMAKGYRVVTLTFNDKQHPIRGTLAIQCGLEEAYHLVQFGGTLIGLRSGFFDVMIYSDCRIISIVDEKYGIKKYCEMESYGVNSDCHTIIYNEDDDNVISHMVDVIK